MNLDKTKLISDIPGHGGAPLGGNDDDDLYS
jgi:hypothetical protein